MSVIEKPFTYISEAESRENTRRILQRLIAKKAFERGEITQTQYEQRQKELEKR